MCISVYIDSVFLSSNEGRVIAQASHHGGPGSRTGSGHVGFVVDRAAIRLLRYLCQSFHRLFRAHRPPLWSSGQSSWLQIQRSGFDSRRYQIFWEVVGLERVHSASWVQLRSYLEEKVAAPVYKTENTAVGIRHADYETSLYPQKLALTSPTNGGRSVSIIRSRTQATEFSF
jgi:hypothetical protein